jgi:beta-phosphoglucomutase-like phosphatase (HAD superfamily)
MAAARSAARLSSMTTTAPRTGSQPAEQSARRRVRARPRRASPRAGPAPRTRPLTLDALSSRWRLAFDAAEDALVGAARCPGLHFPPGELPARSTVLSRERADTARLLDTVAAEEHVPLVHRLSAPRATRWMLGVPSDVRLLVFALDGVLAASIDLHAAAWEETFDEFLARRSTHAAERFAPVRPFNRRTDYPEHLHGRPRLEGVRSLLASRGITLPEGAPADPPGTETVYGLANRKNVALQRRLERQGVAAFEGSRRYLEAAREAGLRCAVVSASANTEEILERSGLAELVDLRIDAEAMREQGLRPRPAPDTFLAACRSLGVPPEEAAAFVTSPAGIAAVQAAGLALAVGVNREGRPEALRTAGADRVVFDLEELLDRALRA